jgi:membrane-associated phospholipid phosphatase
MPDQAAESPVVPRAQPTGGWPNPRHLLVLAAGCLATSALMGLAVRSGPTPLDTWLHDVVVRHRGNDGHDLARTLTQGGSTRIVWPMVAVAALVFPRTSGRRRWVTTLAFASAAALAIGVRLELSLALSRPRPPNLDWVTTAGGFAYPSGHTSAATIGAGALGWAITRHLKRRNARAVVWVAVAAYAAVVGWTRIWLGVHWPLDVLGAWLFGVGWMSGMAAFATWVERSPTG